MSQTTIQMRPEGREVRPIEALALLWLVRNLAKRLVMPVCSILCKKNRGSTLELEKIEQILLQTIQHAIVIKVLTRFPGPFIRKRPRIDQAVTIGSLHKPTADQMATQIDDLAHGPLQSGKIGLEEWFMAARQHPQWQPITMLPTLGSHIDGMLEADQGSALRSKPHSRKVDNFGTVTLSAEFLERYRSQLCR